MKTEPQAGLPQVSAYLAVPGRIVHVYGLGKLPLKPVAGIVTWVRAGTNHIAVEVLGNPARQGFRRHELNAAALYDPLTPEQQRAAYTADPNTPWCEWMPYQTVEEPAIAADLAQAAPALLALLHSICNEVDAGYEGTGRSGIAFRIRRKLHRLGLPQRKSGPADCPAVPQQPAHGD